MCRGAWAERTWPPPARASLRCGAEATVGATPPQRLTKPRGSRPAQDGGPSRLPRSGRRGRRLGSLRKQFYDPFGSPPVRCVAITLPLAIGAVNAHCKLIIPERNHPSPSCEITVFSAVPMCNRTLKESVGFVMIMIISIHTNKYRA